MMKSILTTIVFLALAVAGLAQTRNVIVNTNGVVQSPTNFWSADASNARTGLGLGSAATNPATAFQPSSSVLTNLANNNGSSLTNLSAAGVVGILATNGNGAGLTNLTAANITGTIAISNGGTGATTDGGARTNLGLGTNSAVRFGGLQLSGSNGLSIGGMDLKAPDAGLDLAVLRTGATNMVLTTNGLVLHVGSYLFSSGNANGATTTRTNLGLGWSALTNTSTAGFNTSLYGSGTNPVLYNTNGEVVSPTNFWQVAPIVTRFVEFLPSTNATTNITAARNLHIHSLALSITGVTSTIGLPTTNSFDGDVALVVHQGPTSSVTAVRTAGAATNLVTMNQFEQTVEFVFYNNVWQFNHNRSFVEPIFFSGTNATANAAASRDNLGLGTTNLVQFAGVVSPNLYSSSLNALIELDDNAFVLTADTAEFRQPISFDNTTNSAATRTNLGLGLPALTNTDVTNFRTAIELGATNNVTFNDVTASGTLTATGVVTAVTNLVVEGFVDYTAARTNNTPTNIPNFAAHAAWIEVKIGTNSFFLPAYQ